MTSIRRLAYAAVLAVTTLNYAPSLASAQEPARGHFMLTHEVRWENARVPAGEYEFSYHEGNIAPILSLTRTSGARARFNLLVTMAEESAPGEISRLVLESTPTGSYVSAMQLPEFGMSLHFVVPAHARGREMACAAAPESGQ
ncbi:MAG TPA: hypothetical protein VE866_02795 [Candidatus Binatia bacterium]|nr:hypothetical protein [Candidatus Binatia bacterium]